jgi:Immunity protein 53
MKKQIESLQDWYLSNCNGVWEHQYGVAINTIDNPGWSVSIDLEDTNLEHISFEAKNIERNSQDWIVCRISESKFEGFGGVNNLIEIIQIFTDWVNMESYSNRPKVED